jgi:hypothetical protein
MSCKDKENMASWSGTTEEGKRIGKRAKGPLLFSCLPIPCHVLSIFRKNVFSTQLNKRQSIRIDEPTGGRQTRSQGKRKWCGCGKSETVWFHFCGNGNRGVKPFKSTMLEIANDTFNIG